MYDVRGRCIRTEDYLYSVYAPNLDGGKVGTANEYASDFLYDLKKDPYELNNLIHVPEYKAVIEKLKEELKKEMTKAGEKVPVIK